MLIYTIYKSEILWDGDNRDYYKIYYLISIILICFSIISFFISKNIKQYLVISVISLLASLYLFEGYLIYKKELFKKIFKKTNFQRATL